MTQSLIKEVKAYCKLKNMLKLTEKKTIKNKIELFLALKSG
jgi:hypothetical protein